MSTPDDVNSGDPRRDEDPRPPGWYPDPGDRDKQRWWNGERWTDAVMLGPDFGGAPAWRGGLVAVGGLLLAVLGGVALFMVLMAQVLQSWGSNK